MLWESLGGLFFPLLCFDSQRPSSALYQVPVASLNRCQNLFGFGVTPNAYNSESRVHFSSNCAQVRLLRGCLNHLVIRFQGLPASAAFHVLAEVLSHQPSGSYPGWTGRRDLTLVLVKEGGGAESELAWGLVGWNASFRGGCLPSFRAVLPVEQRTQREPG